MNLLVGSYDSDEEEPLARPQELQKEPKEPAEETAAWTKFEAEGW